MVDDYTFGDDPPVRAAAHLASVGDDRGLALLEDAVRVVPVDQRSMTDVLVAAVALDALGRPEAWREVRRSMAKEGLVALADGAEPLARSIAGTLSLVESARAAGHKVPVAFVEEQVARHLIDKGPELAGARALQTFLEEVANS